MHPTLDVLCTAGRDAAVRVSCSEHQFAVRKADQQVWDMRTRANIFTLSGHTSTVADVKCQDADPQIISGSMDSTVRLWDLAAGKCMTTLTHHKKSVRALAIHPTEYSFASASGGGNK